MLLHLGKLIDFLLWLTTHWLFQDGGQVNMSGSVECCIYIYFIYDKNTQNTLATTYSLAVTQNMWVTIAQQPISKCINHAKHFQKILVNS